MAPKAFSEIGRSLRDIDAYHRRHRWLAFPVAVFKKFSDDQAGNLAALVAYYGFFSLFPLLLVLVTILGIVLRGSPSLQHQIVTSALANFPVIGSDLRTNVHSLSSHSALSLVIGILVTLWAGLGVIRTMENAMNTVWDVPFKHRPNMLISLRRAITMLGVLGLATIVSAGTAGIGSGSNRWWLAVLGIAISLLVNLGVFLLAFKILPAADVSWSDVRVGAAVGALAWTVLQAVGGFYVGHELKGATSTYGTFAVVIGLLAWLYLGAQITLIAAEINVVRGGHLWPRSLVNPPLTDADRQVLERLAKVEERRKDQTVEIQLVGADLGDPTGGRAGDGAATGDRAGDGAATGDRAGDGAADRTGGRGRDRAGGPGGPGRPTPRPG
jgi:membrane protein